MQAQNNQLSRDPWEPRDKDHISVKEYLENEKFRITSRFLTEDNHEKFLVIQQHFPEGLRFCDIVTKGAFVKKQDPTEFKANSAENYAWTFKDDTKKKDISFDVRNDIRIEQLETRLGKLKNYIYARNKTVATVKYLNKIPTKFRGILSIGNMPKQYTGTIDLNFVVPNFSHEQEDVEMKDAENHYIAPGGAARMTFNGKSSERTMQFQEHLIRLAVDFETKNYDAEIGVALNALTKDIGSFMDKNESNTLRKRLVTSVDRFNRVQREEIREFMQHAVNENRTTRIQNLRKKFAQRGKPKNKKARSLSKKPSTKKSSNFGSNAKKKQAQGKKKKKQAHATTKTKKKQQKQQQFPRKNRTQQNSSVKKNRNPNYTRGSYANAQRQVPRSNSRHGSASPNRGGLSYVPRGNNNRGRNSNRNRNFRGPRRGRGHRPPQPF